MSKHFCFYAQKNGKSFKNFNKNPLHFRMFGSEEPTKVVVHIVDDAHTHHAFLYSDGKLDLIYQEEDQLKHAFKDGVEAAEASGLGVRVKVRAVDYADERVAA